jgi:uncharacterized membrane protein (DUF2068 family)
MDQVKVRAASFRVIAVFEAVKGLVVLVAAWAVFLLRHRDVRHMTERFIDQLHLDPAARIPRLLLRFAGGATPANIRLVALAAVVYALIRFAEAIGLWHERAWAEWLGVISAGLYLPFEVSGFTRHPNWGHFAAIAVNVAVIVFLGAQLQRRRREALAAKAAVPPKRVDT